MSFANPLGLLGLFSIPLIIWLHQHVMRGQKKTISALFLWQDDQSLKSEGSAKKRLPMTWVLLLELFTAILLSLAIAEPQWQRVIQHPQFGILLDGSASMSGGGKLSPWQESINLLKTIHQRSPDMRMTAVISGITPQIIGGNNYLPQQLFQQLQHYQPQQSGHSLQPALQILNAMFPESNNTLMFSDDARLQYSRLLHVGNPVANTGFIAATWNSGEAPFVALQAFSDKKHYPTALTILPDGVVAKAWQYPLTFDDQGRATALLSIGSVQKVIVQLPEDALAIDNQVVLFSPSQRHIRMRLEIDNTLESHFRKLEQAITKLMIVSDQANVVITHFQTSTQPKTFFTVLLLPTAQKTSVQQDFVINSQHKLMAGFETHGLIWYAHLRKPPDQADVLLRSATTPLLWLYNQQLVFNIDLQKSNFFQHNSFPVLFYNLIDQLDISYGGLTRWNFRQGENIQFMRPQSVKQAISLIAEDGKTTHYDDDFIRLGQLSTGTYQLKSKDWQDKFSVNFLDQGESDLMQRIAQEKLPPLSELNIVHYEQGHITRLLLVLAILALLLAWFLLRRV